MKQLTCEMCGSTDLIKKDGVFVCQSCGTKYSVEEAKKMMIEGTVDVSGSTVKVDNSEKLDNIRTLAKRAKESNDTKTAAQYYAQILEADPNDWEAVFYTTYLDALNIRLAEIGPSCNRVANCLKPVLELINETVTDESSQGKSCDTVFYDLLNLHSIITSNTRSYMGNDADSKMKTIDEWIVPCNSIFVIFGDLVNSLFHDYYRARLSYEVANSFFLNSIFVLRYYGDHRDNKYAKHSYNFISLVGERIKKIEEEKKNEGRDKYWAEHSEEKTTLEAKKKALQDKITEMQAGISAVPGDEEIEKLNKQISSLEKQKSELGLFKVKEKKELQARIDETNSEIVKISNQKQAAIDKIQSEIDSLSLRIKEIDSELTKDRDEDDVAYGGTFYRMMLNALGLQSVF